METNITNIFSMKPKNTTNILLNNPNMIPSNLNENFKTPQTPNNYIQNFGKSDPNQLEIFKEKPDLVERHNRGLRIISGYIKDAIIINKSTTYSDCAEMISNMFLIETNRYQKENGNLKTPAMIDREKQNIKRRVYDA